MILWYRVALILAAALSVLLMPAEKTLGEWIRWVYLHASFDAVGLLAFYAAAILGLGYLVSPRTPLARWAGALWKAGTVFWAGGWIIGTILGIVLWGGWTSAEPRNLLAPAILLLGIGGWIVSTSLANPKAAAGTYLVGALLVWASLHFTGKVIHPLDPIGSASTLLRLTYTALFIIMGLLGLELTRYLARQSPLHK